MLSLIETRDFFFGGGGQKEVPCGVGGRRRCPVESFFTLKSVAL